jgi:hypothetical protein
LAELAAPLPDDWLKATEGSVADKRALKGRVC